MCILVFVTFLCQGQPAEKTQPAEKAFAVRPPAASASYVLGPQDEFTVRALDAEELQGPYRIDSNGDVRLPMVGLVHCTGLTTEALEAELVKRLKPFIKEPQVTVRMTELRSRPVSVFGAVKKPGIEQLQGETTLIEVLSVAGGLADDAGSVVRVTRRLDWGRIPLPQAKLDPTGQFSVAELGVNSLLDARDPSRNIVVRPNDVITVPRADTIYVLGEVRKAGGFTLHQNETFSVLQALTVAEGMTHTAAPKNARILRLDPESPNRKQIAINLQPVLAGKQPDIPMQPDDILFIPNNVPKSAALRAVEAAIQIGTGVVIWRR